MQPYLSGPMESVAGLVRGGRLVAVVHQRYLRTWPVDCGTSCSAITVVGSAGRERKLISLFEGYEGIFQVQFRDGHLLDVNPRVYGSLPLAVAAGVNLAALEARRSGAEEPGGSSVFPVIPIIPALLTAIAWSLNHYWPKTGYWGGYSFCLLVMLISVGMIFYSQYMIRKLKKNP